jgi:predicted dehydrogenase
MGRFHARVVAEHPETELADIVDAAPEAERVAWERRARWLPSIDEMLAGPLPDAAIVSVPTNQHATVSRPLLEAGVPLLVEKPIASTTEEARSLLDLARAAGVPLAVGHVERFNPAVRALEERLAESALGRVFQIHARRLSPFPRRVFDTGVALDLATHDLDVMCVLGGEPVRISSELDRRSDGAREDLLAALLRFDSGAIGVLEVNWLTPTKVRQLSVTGERGMFVVDYLEQHLTLYENAQASERWVELDVFDGVTEGNVTRFAIAREEPLRAQLTAFVAAVRGEAPVQVGGDEAIRVLKLALLAVEADGRTLDVALSTA